MVDDITLREEPRRRWRYASFTISAARWAPTADPGSPRQLAIFVCRRIMEYLPARPPFSPP
jgi:hypothetical protein